MYAEIAVSVSDVVTGEAASPVIQEVDILFLDSASEPLTTNQDAEGSQAKAKSGDSLLYELFFVPILMIEFLMNLHPCYRPHPVHFTTTCMSNIHLTTTCMSDNFTFVTKLSYFVLIPTYNPMISDF